MQKILRIIGGIIIAVLIVVSIALSTTTKKPSNAELVWDERMTIGNLDAENYFIVYSDLVCPFCIAFENAVIEHEEDFQKYIEANDILLEVRLADFLYRYGESRPVHSRYSAVATYCARDEGKFWDYYNHAITTVWNDFFKNNGKAGGYAMLNLDKSYWTNLGKDVGLGESFESCVENNTPLPELAKNAEKMAKQAGGLPYFKFNSYVADKGFGLDWGWEHVLMYFQAGLESRGK